MLNQNQIKYDVIIAGGGLAGLTLALQLKQSKPAANILVLEKRAESAPKATHKVGESLSELGAYYLREVLNLKGYLTDCQLRKFGFRFFFSPEHAGDITKRVEVGSKIFNPFPSHQVDRGQLENDLVQQATGCGIKIVLGAKVTGVELSPDGHTIQFEKEGSQHLTGSKWFVDSTGRNSFLKRKLDLDKDIDHNINAAWFRLDANIDVDYWSDDLDWRNFIDPGRRRLATNHLMGEGYWVWIIPLIEDRTSIGIVADPRYHPFSGFNSFEKSMNWLRTHEPLAANMLEEHKNKLMDFKVMKHFAYDTKQFYSSQRWAVAGEAGAFLDPLYSPGSDFIGLSNTWITDLIARDLDGEDIALRSLVYDHAHKQLFRGWASIYRDMYGLFGKTQIMLMKIIWDWATYWAIPNVLFSNKGYTDIEVLKQYSSPGNSIGQRFATLNENMQHLFRTWGGYHVEKCSGHQLNVFDLTCLKQLQGEIGQQIGRENLIPRLESNLKLLEQIAAEIFRKVSNEVFHTPMDMKVDPYHMKLDDGKAGLLEKSGAANALPVDDLIKMDIDKMWLKKIKTAENAYG
ncbi:NAD(P)/FAD-dependent oxidoreductase [Chitinophagaceae bacterium LB-8]|uniref:NAD(P)/FAD-dependent oxidoreductase n=1 Tax=Paraflavisolibacter caeni TaxID=2982496 RepID=A0A9X3BJS5_9BACT|nr:NAD(P)/FAD-dependent oxidoreductase [Paraflavisolibacter caeni]MCU7551603.1 NAD(P)/FAD-dependent oxidoreductase [Paraflavisolibacter caeni]